MTGVRRDLFTNGRVAHVSLRGQVTAERFEEGVLQRVAVPVADLRLDPGAARLDRQILQGHPVCLLDPESGFCRDETSGYVGHLPPASLVPWVAPTHRIRAARSLIFDAADIKAPGPVAVSCGALVSVTEISGRFARLDDGRFAIAAHLEGHDARAGDWVARAEALLGTPYLWGGNSAFGIDCSGLVQLGLQAAGRPCPGDSDQQRETLGTALAEGARPERGDLFFWPGHVAIACDAETLIHANAHAMAVAYEPIAATMARIDAAGEGPLLAHKRLP